MMRRSLCVVLVVIGCADPMKAVDPPENGYSPPPPASGDYAVRDAFGGWYVRLSTGMSCDYPDLGTLTAAEAITRCRHDLLGWQP